MRRKRHTLALLCLCAAAASAVPGSANAGGARSEATADPARPGNLAKAHELQRMIDEQQRQLNTQQAQLDAQWSKQMLHVRSDTDSCTDFPPERFFVGTDINLYYDAEQTGWHKRPDWFAVLGASRLYRQHDLRLSYVVCRDTKSYDCMCM